MTKAIGDRVGLRSGTTILEGTVWKVDRRGVHVIGDDGLCRSAYPIDQGRFPCIVRAQRRWVDLRHRHLPRRDRQHDRQQGDEDG